MEAASSSCVPCRRAPSVAPRSPAPCAARRSVEDRINLHQLMELKAAFDRADTDQGGSLDMEEAREAMLAALRV